MTTVFLPAHLQEALAEAAELIPEVAAGRATWSTALALCDRLRIAGIAELFLTADGVPLRRRLYQSGRAFLAYLRSASPGERWTSRASPFFDALAAGDTPAAMAMASLLPVSAVPGEEYEEDVLFVRLLMDVLRAGSVTADAEQMLAKWELVLAGSEDLRLEVCQAMLARDAGRFSTALVELLEDEENRLTRLFRADALGPERFHTEGNFSVVGAAVLRLAARLAMRTEVEYPRVPSLARGDLPPDFSPDSWRTLETS